MTKKTKLNEAQSSKKPATSPSSMNGFNFMQEDKVFDTLPPADQNSQPRNGETLH